MIPEPDAQDDAERRDDREEVVSRQLISDRLRILRSAANASQDEIAEAINCSQNAVSKWDRAKSVPPARYMARLADFYSERLRRRVSIDYILGRSDSYSGFEPDTWLVDDEMVEKMRRDPKAVGAPLWKVPRRLSVASFDEMEKLRRELQLGDSRHV